VIQALQPIFLMRNSLIPCLVVLLVCGLAAGCSSEAKKARTLERAGKFFAAGELEQAKVEYLNVLQMDPQNPVATERMGLIWYEQGGLYRALPILLRTRAQMPGNYEARTKLAVTLAKMGRLEEARQEAITVIRNSPTANEALFVLTETIRTQDDLDVTLDVIAKSRQAQSAWGLVASAKVMFFQENLTNANAQLQRALSLDPKSSVAHAAMAELHFRMRDQQKGRDSLRQGAELAPLRSTIKMSYAEYLVQSGSIPDAIAYLQTLTLQVPDFISPKRMLAQIALSEKRFDEVKRRLTEILAIDSVNIDAALLQAQLLVAQGNVAVAIEQLEALSAANPGFGTIEFQLARTLLSERKVERAVAVLEAGIAAHPEYVESSLLLAEINLRRGKAQDSVVSLFSLLQRRPGLVQAQSLLVTALQSLGRLDEAGAAIREQIRVLPKSPQPHVVLGGILQQQNQAAGARMAFERALELDPNYVPAVAALVDLDRRERHFDAALTRVQAQISKTPDLADLRLIEATVFIDKGKWLDAERTLKKAIEVKPDLPRAYELLIFVYTSSNRLPEAARQLEETLAAKPDDLRARQLSGIVYGQLGEYQKSAEAYERVLAVAPGSSISLNNLANLYAERLNRLDRAYELATKARSVDPASPMVADTLGWIYFKRKDYPRALELIAESVAKLPESAEVQYHFGVVNQVLGNRAAAMAAFEKAAQTTGEFVGKSEIAGRLAELRHAGVN